ncbi:MAG: helix-hairpin-helix domain-containing protein [Prolixibacteraceae bacterium]|jgi:DNA uptake protein ComE-like DNA-binding protein|nr:helix-hairpin-helix domain-containing protein [Prolixibacteraceae bacterium]NLO04022.1 helix-hairpin-helix domain-containing protein [Bacteroidales bacterium]
MIRFFRQAREIFAFSKGDRNAVITLAILIIIALAGHFLIGFVSLNRPTDHSEFELAMAAWQSRQDTAVTRNIVLFDFDPNTVSARQLDSLSLPKRIKDNLLKYRAAGGRLLKPAGLKKIYGMNDSIYEAVKGYIKIEDLSDTFTDSKENYFESVPVDSPTGKTDGSDAADQLLELNSADSLQLVRLRGIGPVFAARIIKYRNLLGGYYSAQQLLEVYNFPEETFYEIRRYITVDTAAVKKIRINYAGYSELLRHPYFEKSDVKKIIEYREKHGSFSTVGQILQLEPADSLKRAKIGHYLTCR